MDESFAWARNLENLRGPSRKIPRAIAEGAGAGGAARPEIVLRFVLRSDRYPIERRAERTRLIRRFSRRARNFYNGEIVAINIPGAGDRTARRSGKLRPGKTGSFIRMYRPAVDIH